VAQAILWSHRAHQADDILLGLRCLTLHGLPLGVLFCKMPADHAPANCPDDSMVPRVMPSDPTYNRAFVAASGVRRSYCCQGQGSGQQGDFYRASFHSKVL
jgi:hypothetical protein